MTKSSLNKFVLIGAGNVATLLAIALHNKEKKIVQVYSMNIENAKRLADKIAADYTNDLKNIQENADVYIIAVSDDAIEEIVSNISIKDGLLIHTAGSVDMNVLIPSAKNYGVLYPLQTLSMKINIDFYNEVPLCIEANTDENHDKLYELAKELSAQVHVISSDDRKILHLAAVFVNNFTNYMFVAACRLLKDRDLSYSMLMPIITETVKILEQSKSDGMPEVLTGPALRKDMVTIAKHIELLKDFPDLKKVYETITGEILNLKGQVMTCPYKPET